MRKWTEVAPGVSMWATLRVRVWWWLTTHPRWLYRIRWRRRMKHIRAVMHDPVALAEHLVRSRGYRRYIKRRARYAAKAARR